MSARIDLGPKPTLGYTASRIERAAELRTDEAAIARLAADPRPRAYVVGGELIVHEKGDDRSRSAVYAGDERIASAPVDRDRVPRRSSTAPRASASASTAAAAEALKDTARFAGHRSALDRGAGAGRAEHLPPLAEAKALLHWHARHRFCANCGTPPTCRMPAGGATARTARPQHFPRTDPVVIMLAVDGERCLLGRSPRFAPTCGRASRASSSRAKPSRMRCGARRWKKPESAAGE